MKFILLFILIILGVVSYAQKNPSEQKKDSLDMIYDGNEEKDSLDIVKDGKEEKVINDVKQFTKRRNLVSRILGNFFSYKDEQEYNPWDYSYEQFEDYRGKIIRNIEIVPLEVFGPSIHEKKEKKKSFIEKAGDFLHVKTKKWILRRQLLFSKGDQLRPFELAESERILRNRQYLYDADIIVENVNGDSVDLTVITQDLWSIVLDGSFSLNNKSAVGTVREINFLGYGIELEGSLKLGDEYAARGWNWDGEIMIDNIFEKYVYAKAYRNIDPYTESHGISIERNFISPLIGFAGGLNLDWIKTKNFIHQEDSFQTFQNNFNMQEVWLGYATNDIGITKTTSFQNEYYVTAGIKNINYDEKNEQLDRTLFQDNKRYLLTLGYSFRRYYKARYVAGLGRIEDIPSGLTFTLTNGFVNGSNIDKYYTGIGAGYSFYDLNAGYFSASVDAGGYFYHNKMQNSAIRSELFYFSNLYDFSIFKQRHFLWLRHNYFHHPNLIGNFIRIEDEQGIRGLKNEIYGNKKIVLNYELNLYPPIKIFGFSFAIIGFADIGILSKPNETLWEGDFHQGYGLGLRIRNEHLIFQSIQLLFGVYPGTFDSPVRSFRFFNQGRNFYNLEKFQIRKPLEIDFIDYR